LAMLSPLSREASVVEQSLEYAGRRGRPRCSHPPCTLRCRRERPSRRRWLWLCGSHAFNIIPIIPINPHLPELLSNQKRLPLAEGAGLRWLGQFEKRAAAKHCSGHSTRFKSKSQNFVAWGSLDLEAKSSAGCGPRRR